MNHWEKQSCGGCRQISGRWEGIECEVAQGMFLEKGNLIPILIVTVLTGLRPVSKINQTGDFSGGPVAKTWPAQRREPRFNAWSGNEVPHATPKTQYSQTNK